MLLPVCLYLLVSPEKSTKESPDLTGAVRPENPQVAFVLVVENAGTGTTPLNAKYITQVLQYWFSDRDKFDGVR